MPSGQTQTNIWCYFSMLQLLNSEFKTTTTPQKLNLSIMSKLTSCSTAPLHYLYLLQPARPCLCLLLCSPLTAAGAVQTQWKSPGSATNKFFFFLLACPRFKQHSEGKGTIEEAGKTPKINKCLLRVYLKSKIPARCFWVVNKRGE